ncbi:MAG: hypothetical protein IH571_04560 [Acholeplasmataceae bacterium]|nr:hypothetical protein [Acholeplasmataceae bacterium]
MITFFYTHYFFRKKRILFLLSVLLVGVVLVLLTHTDEPEHMQKLFFAYHKAYHQMLMQKTLTIALPFLVVVFSFEHDQNFLKPLFAYFGRLYVGFYKLLFHYLSILWLYLVIFSFSVVITAVMTSFYDFLFSQWTIMLDLLLDGFILLNMILFLIKDKSKAFAVILGLLYAFLVTFYEDQTFFLIYYLLPLHAPYFLHSTLIFYYKSCYILLGFILILRKTVKEQLK